MLFYPNITIYVSHICTMTLFVALKNRYEHDHHDHDHEEKDPPNDDHATVFRRTRTRTSHSQQYAMTTTQQHRQPMRRPETTTWRRKTQKTTPTRRKTTTPRRKTHRTTPRRRVWIGYPDLGGRPNDDRRPRRNARRQPTVDLRCSRFAAGVVATHRHGRTGQRDDVGKPPNQGHDGPSHPLGPW